MIDIDELIECASNLEPLSQTVTRLLPLLNDNAEADIAEIEKIFSFDPVLTSRLLRQANSAGSGSRNVIGTVSAAVVRLGLGSVFSLAVSASVEKVFSGTGSGYGLTEGDIWRHSQLARTAVDSMRRYVKVPPEAQTAALLHDFGKTVLIRFLPSEAQELLDLARTQGAQRGVEAETEILQIHHGELGALIAQHWKMPDIIVRGISYHHDPQTCLDRDNLVCHIVCLADWLANSAAARLNGETWLGPLPPSAKHLGISPDQAEAIIVKLMEQGDM